MANNENLIPIPGRLHSVATEGHVAGANEIYDDTLQKNQATINAENSTALESKVDKEKGKGLSTNDYSDSEKAKVSSHESALAAGGSVDTRIAAAVNALDAEVSQAASSDGLSLSVSEVDGKITSISGSIASNTYDTYGAASTTKSELLGNAATDYNTLGKCEDKIQANANDIDDLEALVPTQATSSNQLADKEFVNSSVSTATATFRGTSEAGLTETQFLTWANSLTKDLNDYVFWNTVDTAGNTQYKRYKYNGIQWVFEYTLNNSSFTAAQWAAIESGMTEALKDKLVGLPTSTEISQQISAEAVARASADSAINTTIGTDSTSGTVKGRIKVLEDAVGTGGSVDFRIADAKSEIKGSATSACDTLGEAEALISAEKTRAQGAETTLQNNINAEATARANAVSTEASRAQAAESVLQNNIEALTQSNIVVVADHTSVSSPDPLTIYREQGTNTYSDWMYQNGSWMKMAEYDNAIDDVPTSLSDNLVKSRGVDLFIKINAAPGGINLLNKKAATIGLWLNTNTGMIYESAENYMSDYIYVKGMNVVTFTGLNMSNYGGWQLFNENKERISYGPNASSGITIGNAVYLQVNGKTEYLNKDMVIEGSNMPNVYVPYTNSDKVSLYDIESQLHLEQTNLPIADKLQLVPTTYESGIFENPNQYYSTSDYIEINPGVQCYYLYFLNTGGNIEKLRFYDKDKNIIEGALWSSLSAYASKILKFVFPKGCQYVRYVKQNGVAYDGIYTCEISNFETDVQNLVEPNIISIVEKKDYILEQTNPPITENLEVIPTTFEDGIFGVANQFYKTSDYIEVSLGVKAYYLYFQNTSGNVYKVIFYDENKNSIKELIWQDLNEYVGNILKINLPINCKYVRYCRIKAADYDGIYTCKVSTIEKDFVGMLYKHYTDTNNILWVGTSIPEGATYPQVSAAACGYNCIKKAKGSQSLAIRTSDPLCMMYTQQEFYDNFHSRIGDTLTQAEYNNYIDFTFERNVLPFVRGESLNVNDGDGVRTINPDNTKVSAIVIDHNYNDWVNIENLLRDEENIDWDSRDRTNFVGALNYLLDEIRYIVPTFKIVLAGYFQHRLIGEADVCKMASLCAEHMNLEIMKTWEYSQINDKIIKGTSNYMANFNATYGTSYVVPASAQDSQGNITARYIYLPDGIHPHSDLTQNCNHRLDAIYSKLLKNII